MKNNNKMLLVVVLVLVVIVGMLIYDRTQEPQSPAEALGNVIEQMQDDITEAKEEIQDEIDDHTTTRQ